MAVNVINVHIDQVYETSSAAATAMLNRITETLIQNGFTQSSNKYKKGPVTVYPRISGSRINFDTSISSMPNNSTSWSLNYTGSGSAYGMEDWIALEVTTTDGWYWSTDCRTLYGQGHLHRLEDGALDTVMSQCSITISDGNGMSIFRDTSSTSSPSFTTSGATPYFQDGSLVVFSGYIKDNSNLGLKFEGGLPYYGSFPSGYTINTPILQDRMYADSDLHNPAKMVFHWLPF